MDTQSESESGEWPKKEIIMKQVTKSSPNSCSNIISNSNSNNNNPPSSTSSDRKAPPPKGGAVNCPRCTSTNTKFCYYNNYSLTQPRYFCKACKRYWTEGGSLRNIPVGGGSRKNKRPSSYESPSAKRISSHHDLESHHMMNITSNPNSNFLSHQVQYLNLGFPSTPTQQHFTSLSQYIQLPTMESTPVSNCNTSATPTSSVDHPQHRLSAMELLQGLTSSRGLTPYIPMSVPDPDPDPDTNDVYSSGYPSLNFSLDAHGNGYGNLHAQQGDVQNSGGRMLFPFEDLKQVSSTTNIDDDDADADADGDHNTNTNTNNNHDDEQDRDVDGDGESTNVYWSGMLGNGGSW